MARPRSQPATSRQSTDLSKLSSEVLRLRLQQMNLPVTGNHARLVERLRSANGTRQLSATTRNKRADGRVAKRSSTSSKRSQQAARSLTRQSATSNLASEPHDLDQVLDHFPEEEDSATSDLLADLDAEPMESMKRCRFYPGSTSGDPGHCFVDRSSSVSIAPTQRRYPACSRVFQHSKYSCFFCGASERPQSSLGQSPRGQNTPRPYHQSDDCPHQEPSKKPRRSALVCFDFNKPSGCQRRTCHFPHNCRRCGSSSHALFNCPSSKQHATSTKSAIPGDRSKK